MVRTELKIGKAPGIDNVHNIVLNKAIGTGFYKVLARAFTISPKLGFIPHVWKIAVLCMLIKPDKPPSQTTSYRPISLLSAIMKLFERVIEKRLRKHLEDNGFFSKYQSGFRKSKSTSQHGCLVVVFPRCHKHPKMVGPRGRQLIILHYYWQQRFICSSSCLHK